jgi:hypothetical protein
MNRDKVTEILIPHAKEFPMWRSAVGLFVGFGVLVIAGCNTQQNPAAAPPSAEAQRYLLATEPEGGVEVIAARKTVKNDDEVVIVGRIGGSEDPWVKGQAAFTIVDPSLKACSDIEGDNCPTPWDYCCVTEQLKTGTALVKVVDSEGKPLPSDAKDFLKLQELATVVVRGRAVRDEAGNLTVLANGLHVRH